MFNFAGKSAKFSPKPPQEIDFNNFWKTIDESYFQRVEPNSLDSKSHEILEKIIPFTGNHHNGIFFKFRKYQTKKDQEIISHLRNEMPHENSLSYFEHYMKKCRLVINPIEDKKFSDSEHKYSIFGHKLMGIQNESQDKEKHLMKIADQESFLSQYIEKRKVINKSLINK